MNSIAMIIPTLDAARAEPTAKIAMVNKGNVEARVIISNGPRRGFTLTVNDGIRQTNPDEDVCIMNDDMHLFYPGWLEVMQKALYSMPSFGIAGPSGKSSTAPMRDGQLGMLGIEVVDRVPFWCALIKRKVFDKIGLLDESFIHYGSDNWFCDQAQRQGFHTIWVRDVFIVHQHHGSGLITEWREHDDNVMQLKLRKLAKKRRQGR